ncbi:DUF3618 domain-containing protein [Actinoplanes sp. M2I2]|uniref:DUF3618 domain-containing protein n=1 Tax=Actinoplanes sp. M2I2 TaxID=1734444 RepID=UPI0020206C32|nr:DUF3618 domain-containing protein [Actinoplanes sp. M2I2]
MSEKNGSPADKPSIDELRADIKQTRAELGETVQALAAKADVKARAKEQVEQTKLKVKAQAVEATERVRGAAVAAAGAVSGKVHEVADQTAAKADEVDVRETVRNSPVPLPLVVAGVVAIVGVILIIRGRRR